MQPILLRPRTAGVLGLALAFGAACADGSATTPTGDGDITFAVVSGNNQSAPAGTELPQPLVVRATSSTGAAVSNQIINFRVVAGGGTVYAGTARTNSNGEAREWWTLGPTAGANRIEARAVHPGTGERQVFGVFDATGTTGGTTPTPVLTSVVVTPDSSNIQVGQTVQLSAALRDQNGAPMSGTASWSSLDGAVATVSGSGLVTGAAAGTARIVGASGGRADTAKVVVTTTAPPPPPSTTTGALLFGQDFESGSFATWDDGYDPNTHRIITGGLGAHGGSRYLEIVYPAGSIDGGGWLTKFFGPGEDSVHFSYWVRFPSTWTGGSYLMGLYGSPTNNLWGGFGKAGVCSNGTNYTNHFLYVTGGGSPGPLSFYTYHMDMLAQSGDCWGDAGTGRATYGTGRSMSRGVWHRVELKVKLNTPGQANGWERMYIDGVMQGEWMNLRQRSTTGIKINALQLSAQTSGGAASATRTLHVDDVAVNKLVSP